MYVYIYIVSVYVYICIHIHTYILCVCHIYQHVSMLSWKSGHFEPSTSAVINHVTVNKDLVSLWVYY